MSGSLFPLHEADTQVRELRRCDFVDDATSRTQSVIGPDVHHWV
ncbi:hypothetical protein [Asaia krungthepensis]|nr:hypothetical protein [Asaia krungthepensis]